MINSDNIEQLDRQDPLATYRNDFHLPSGLVYLNGNSLGAMPLKAVVRARQVVEKEWAEGLIGSMNTAGWFDLPVSLGNKIANLVGADPGEVVFTDSTGIDLYKVLSAALQLKPQRRVVVIEGSNFPTNNYMVEGLLEQLGDGYGIRYAEAGELVQAIDDDVAAVCLTHVHYKTGGILDMARITALAHAAGAAAVWDLCHSVGTMPVELNTCGVDFAVGCTYKYLNGGPGSPAMLFAAKRHHGRCRQPLTGWFGHAAPFDFDPHYHPAPDIRQMLSGTQPIVSLSIAEIGIDLMLSANLGYIRDKAMKLTSLFIEGVEALGRGNELVLVSPRIAEHRGSQVSFQHDNGYAIVRALHDRGVICDYREPGIMRFGFAPLYNSYADILHAAEILGEILKSGCWADTCYQYRETVT